MASLPLANLLHHKVRSVLSALGVAIGVCMLVTLSGLARGSLEEVADRWDAVDADLIVYPAHWGDNITTISGGGLGETDLKAVQELSLSGRPLVRRGIPVFLYRFEIGGQDHNVVGVRPGDLPHLLGGMGIRDGGRVFDPDGAFARWLKGKLSAPTEEVVDLPAEELARRGGLEMVIDARLARAAGLEVGSRLRAVGHEFTVVGVVPAGGLARAFIPLSTAQFLFNGRLGRSTLMFVKLRQGARPGEAIQAVRRRRHLSAVAVNEFRGMLLSRFGIMYRYVDAVNAVTLTVALLFILVTLYTMVIQRTREIALLRSMGATRRFVLAELVQESLILTAVGAAWGVLLALPAGDAIELLNPLLTVTITWRWVALAGAVALVGGAAAAVYPAWYATRIDVTEALTLE